MTNERAIELLNRISDSQFDGQHGDERREALEMAIRALEGDGDMISRQAVMKEFSDFVRKSNNSDYAQTPTWNDAVSLVGSMPSAQPERMRFVQQAVNTIMHTARSDSIKDKSFRNAARMIQNAIDGEPQDFEPIPDEPEWKTGKWINHRKDDGHNIADCDQCGNAIQWFDGDEIPRYCCMCGADMRGEQDE